MRYAMLAGVGAFTLAVALTAPAQAQEASPPPVATAAEPEDTGGLRDIVVYAQRKSRGEELQSVPVAVTAVDSVTLEAMHAVDIRDVGRLVPNAQLDGVGTFPGFANFFMRGVGVSTSVRSLDPAVNIVQDGMVVGYQAGAVLDTFDSEGVEVLRGPQGVLFGRNASGGVVSLRSKRPRGEFAADFKLTYGNAGTIETRAAVEDMIVKDTVFARFAVLTRNNNGFFTNDNHGNFLVIPPTVNVNPTGAAAGFHEVEQVSSTSEVVVKSTVVFKLADTTKFTLLGQYLNFNDGGGATRTYLPAGAALRQLQTVWGWYPSDQKWGVNLGTSGYTKIKGYHLIGELEQDIGPGTLTAIGAYRDIRYNATLNVGGDPFDVLLFPDGRERARQKSIEARYNIDLGDRLSLLVGAFYFDLEFDRVPKWTGYLGANYDVQVANNTMSLHAGYAWRSHAYLDVLNTPELAQKGYGLLDASLNYTVGKWTVGLFGRNIANVEYAEIKSAGLGFNAFGGSPRYYGVELGAKF